MRRRLSRVRVKQQHNDVWPRTNGMEPARLSVATAARCYRGRWEKEGTFRAYQRTLLQGERVRRTVRWVHRAADPLALQLLRAQGVLAVPRAAQNRASPVCSPIQVFRAIRYERAGLLHQRHPS